MKNQKQDLKAFIYPPDYLKLLTVISKKQEYSIKFLINTGARINEAIHVEKRDIDGDRKTIMLRITKTRARLGERRPSPRVIPISDDFYKYLKKNINKYKIMSKNQIGLILKSKLKEIRVNNYSDFSSHNLRKTFGTWMLALGVDGFKLAQHLGHSAEMLRTKYASPDIFNYKDKDIMREVLGDLPSRLRNY